MSLQHLFFHMHMHEFNGAIPFIWLLRGFLFRKIYSNRACNKLRDHSPFDGFDSFNDHVIKIISICVYLIKWAAFGERIR